MTEVLAYAACVCVSSHHNHFWKDRVLNNLPHPLHDAPAYNMPTPIPPTIVFPDVFKASQALYDSNYKKHNKYCCRVDFERSVKAGTTRIIAISPLRYKYVGLYICGECTIKTIAPLSICDIIALEVHLYYE